MCTEKVVLLFSGAWAGGRLCLMFHEEYKESGEGRVRAHVCVIVVCVLVSSVNVHVCA